MHMHEDEFPSFKLMYLSKLFWRYLDKKKTAEEMEQKFQQTSLVDYSLKEGETLVLQLKNVSGSSFSCQLCPLTHATYWSTLIEFNLLLLSTEKRWNCQVQGFWEQFTREKGQPKRALDLYQTTTTSPRTTFTVYWSEVSHKLSPKSQSSGGF